MPPRVDSIALLECTMQMIREAHTNWNKDQILEHAFSVMNLQPNTVREAKKIPKSVLSIISHIVKLNKNNWAIWEPMFMDCICPIKNAKHILTGEIPNGHADYNEELDSHLLGLILSSCNHGPDSHIDTYMVQEQGEEEQLGSTLYKKLKATLTINNEAKLSAIHDHVHEIKLVNCNIVNLGKELDRIWNDAVRLGSRMDEKCHGSWESEMKSAQTEKLNLLRSGGRACLGGFQGNPVSVSDSLDAKGIDGRSIWVEVAISATPVGHVGMSMPKINSIGHVIMLGGVVAQQLARSNGRGCLSRFQGNSGSVSGSPDAEGIVVGKAISATPA